jgi:hypothetical protein
MPSQHCRNLVTSVLLRGGVAGVVLELIGCGKVLASSFSKLVSNRVSTGG